MFSAKFYGNLYVGSLDYAVSDQWSVVYLTYSLIYLTMDCMMWFQMKGNYTIEKHRATRKEKMKWKQTYHALCWWNVSENVWLERKIQHMFLVLIFKFFKLCSNLIS